MLEALLTTAVFWATFEFTPGPFWIAFMQAAKGTPLSVLLRQYAIFVVLGSGTQTILVALLVGKAIALHPYLHMALYFVGAGVLLMFACQAMHTPQKQLRLDFNWFKMSLVSWSSPKAWTAIPAGALNATYTQIEWLNAILFFVVSLPICAASGLVWGYLGKLSAGIHARAFSYATTALLAGYGIYLFSQGVAKIG